MRLTIRAGKLHGKGLLSNDQLLDDQGDHKVFNHSLCHEGFQSAVVFAVLNQKRKDCLIDHQDGNLPCSSLF